MNESQVFAHALELSDPAERAAYLDRACAGDARLRADVEALLRAHASDPDFLERPADPLGETVDEPVTPVLQAGPPGAPGSEQPGAVLAGRYRLLEQIGAGGMGVVWKAQQTEPVRRPVALKVIKPGMDSQQMLARFEAERQALALMDHPNVARVLDAGATDSGRPYFVMELVEGVPITKYCDEQRLTPRQRLQLFIPVCRAIQHAHQKGVIHRDIKPSNVLVASYDGRPVPKVIDFGIAKAAAGQLTGQTLMTGVGMVVGTLEYMSPEQAELNALDIDTRADVYSLGVLLYELLTGSTPLQRRRLQEMPLTEVLRLIREEEPPRPSTRLSKDEVGRMKDESKKTNRSGWSRFLPFSSFILPTSSFLSPSPFQELDWIVMRALEKDRNRRYESATALAEDVRRYLDDEPVQACPPSAGYRLRKLARRNKRAFVSAAAVLLFVVLALVGLSVGLVVIQWEKDAKENAFQAEQIAHTQTQQALEQADKEKKEKEAALKEKGIALRKTQEALEEVTRQKNEVIKQKKEAVTQKNLALFRLKFAQTAVRDCLHSVTWNQQLQAAGFHELRKALLTPSVKILLTLESSYKDDPGLQDYLAEVYSDLAFLRQEIGEHEEALKDYQRARDVLARLAERFPDKPKHQVNLAQACHNAATLLSELGRRGEAEPLYKESLRRLKKVIRDGHDAPDYRYNQVLTQICLGLLCSELGRTQEALDYYDEALPVARQLVKEFPKNADYREALGGLFSNRGKLFLETGRLPEAEAAHAEAVALKEKLADEFPLRPDFRQQLAMTYANLALAQARRGKHKEAEASAARALAAQEKLVNDYPKVPTYALDLARSHNNRGSQRLAQGKLAEALTSYRRAVALYEGLVRTFPKVLSYAEELGHCYTNVGYLSIMARQPNTGLPWFSRAIATLEAVLKQEGKLARAREALRKAHRGRAEALNMLRRHAEALAEYDKALELADGPMRVLLRSDRAVTLAALKEHARAREEADALATGKDLSVEVLCNLACVYAQSAGAAQKDAAQADHYAGRAVELLRRAVGTGFKEVGFLKDYSGFAPLRHYKPFQELLKELEAGKGGP